MVTIAVAAGLVSCSKDPLDGNVPDGSVGQQLIGRWALIETSGGLLGQPVTFDPVSSPDQIEFRNDRSYERFTPTDTTEANYWVVDVARVQDTLSFRFALAGNELFVGRRVRIVGGKRLETIPECCDQVDQVFARLP